MHLAHGTLETTPETLEEQAELAIAIRVAGVRNRVLFPQQLQGDAFALQLLMQMRKVGLGMPCNERRRARKQQRLELPVIHRRWQRPAEPHLAGAPHILGGRSLGNPGGGSDTVVA